MQNIDLAEIEKIAHHEKALFVKIEPFTDISSQEKLDKLFFTYGYVHDFWPLSSTSTYMLDLQKPLEQIVANFKSKFRYNLRLAENKHKLTVQTINGAQLVENVKKYGCHSCEGRNLLKLFTQVFNQRARQIKSDTHSFRELLHTCHSHGKNLVMLYILSPKVQSSKFKVQNDNLKFKMKKNEIAQQKGNSNLEMIAVAMFLKTPDILHYWHNGSTQEGRSLFAPTLIMAEGIKLGQKLGCKIFDFEGIYDERFPAQTKRWKGFTRFKEGFGPEKVVFVQPYIKYYSPVFRFFHFFKMI